jgi:tetratricopeptide (TPR) repeat protein
MKSPDAKQELARLVAEGREHHIAGNLPAAEHALRQALHIEPEDPEALHRLGMILDAHGQSDAAIELLRRSILRAPLVPEFFNNLGEAFRKAGHFAEAMRAYERSLQLRAANPEALHNMAMVLLELGDPRALENARAAAKMAPSVPQVYRTLGRALHSIHDYGAALLAYREALQLDPKNAQTIEAAVISLAAAGHPIDTWDFEIPADVTDSMLQNAAGQGFLAVGKYEQAAAHLNEALRLNPGYLAAMANLAMLFNETGEPEKALEMVNRALTVQNVSGLHVTKALSLLTLGRYREGFGEYEFRPKPAGPTFRGTIVPQWAGQPIGGKTILLTSEQGFGDTIQFIRFAALLARQNAKVWVQSSDLLAPLLASVEGVEKVFTPQQQLPRVDFYCPMASLPHLLGTELDSIPSNVPYIHASESRVDAWRERFSQIAGGGFKVGLVWQGNPRHLRDRMRSIPLPTLAPPLANVDGVRLFSLQKHHGRDQTTGVPQVQDLDAELTTFEETAAAISALDLVISVDTSVAHLAGALGRPVWTLLGLATDWRWLLKRTDSPWYPTMKLYRQQSGNWAEVIARVATDLAEASRR